MHETFLLITPTGEKPIIYGPYQTAQIRDANAFSLNWKRIHSSKAIHRLDVYNDHIAKVTEFSEDFFKGVYMIKGRFTIDDGPVYEGYHVFGQCWNGWEMPYFTRDIAEQILKDCPDDVPQDEGGYAGYNFPLEDAKEIIDLENPIGKLVVWGIGAGGWCWDLVEPEEQPAGGVSKPDHMDNDQYAEYLRTAEGNAELTRSSDMEEG